MKNQVVQGFALVVLLALLIGTAEIQMRLKVMPQILMLVVGGLTISSFFTQYSVINRLFFYLLVGYMLVINLFSLWNQVFRRIHNCENEHNEIYLITILSFFFLFFYHKSDIKNKKIEIAVTSLFLIATTTIFIIFEIL